MIKDAKIVGIWGGRGSGKSTCAKAMVRGQKRVIVVDPLGDWGGEGFKEVTSHAALYKIIKSGWKTGFRVCFNIGRVPDKVAALSKLSHDLFIIQQPYKDGKDKRKLYLVVDEMSISVPNRRLADNERSFLDLCNLGRHWGVEVIGISQHMAQVNTDFRGNTAENYYFRLGEAIDVNAALQKIGSNYRSQLQGLQTHEYLMHHAGTVTKGKNKLTNRASR